MSEGADILVVDDTNDVLTVLVRILERAGYVVRSAESGERALASVAHRPPDLIIADVRMHGIDGLELCRVIKSNEATQQIPIILMSGLADVDEWVQGLRSGAADYITKPFQREELLSRVRTHLALRRAAVSLEEQAAELRRTNARLVAEFSERQQVEHELRQSLQDAERVRRAMLSALEDQQRSAAELRQSEEKFRAIFETSSDAILTLEPPVWNFTSANPATLSMFRASSASEFAAYRPSDLSPERQPDGCLSSTVAMENILAAMRDGHASFEWTHKRVSGEEFPATVTLTRTERGGRQFLQATVRDISEQKRLEAELGHARKLEAVGQLAAGIAHEINTPSQFVGDGLHFLKEAFDGYRRLVLHFERTAALLQINGGHEELLGELRQLKQEIDLPYLEENVPAALDRCIDGVARVATIVRAMREFAHPDEREKAAADLNQALRNTLVITKNEYKYVADVAVELGELPPVLCHLGDLNQVLLNLIVNAAHAISDVVGKEGAKGLIQIKTSRDGDWARIEVGDSGAGIPESIRHRIFEPFFTTKAVGRGSGQGLAIARSIVVGKHSGTLTFTSEVGQGTRFVIRLPIDGHAGRQI